MKPLKYVIGVAIGLCCAAAVYAATAATTFGDAASKVTAEFENIALLITGASYVAGLAFAIGAIMKFKQHKDSPTQVPVGTPIALVFIAGALLFFPSLLKLTGMSIFGSTVTATQKGITWGAGGT